MIINKIDLIDDESAEVLEQFKEIYQNIGYKIIETSALTGFNIESLKKEMVGKTSLFAGHSGVGKSTLLNTLLPHAKQETKEVSDYSAKGVHTTTFAELFFLPGSGDLIDTPGIKEFGILDVAEEELSHFFPEMRQYLGQCKYNNCTHVNEPGCVVLEKLNEGYIHPYRYQSYLNILSEEDSHR